MARALIEDTNNKPGKHVAKNEYWASIGREVTRCKLPYGDYILAPPVVVDTKNSVDELAMDLKSDHARFRDAAIKAMQCGTHMVILVENEEGVADMDGLRAWVESDKSYRNRKRRNANAQRYKGTDVRIAKDGHEYDMGLAHICESMERDYWLEFQFCRPDEAGRRVLEILGEVTA